MSYKNDIYVYLTDTVDSDTLGKLQHVWSVRSVSRAQLFATPWTEAHQAPLSMRFSGQGYWSGLPFPSSGHLPNPGIEPGFHALQADSLLTELQGKPMCVKKHLNIFKKIVCIDFTFPCHGLCLPTCELFAIFPLYIVLGLQWRKVSVSSL